MNGVSHDDKRERKDEKKALITGASSGIGMALAREYAKQGWQLILLARRRERLDDLAAQLATPLQLLAADVSSRSQVAQALENLPADFADIDVLVNNADPTCKRLWPA